jgi:hypothetical protein
MKGSKRDRQNVNNMNKAMWEDCSNGWMCSKCFRDSTYDYYKCQHCGCIMLNGTCDIPNQV